MRTTIPPVDRIMRRVEVQPNGCWIRRGYKMPNGYDAINVGGKTRYSHVVMYEHKYGPVPTGKELDHFFCDNRGCCNPDHVRPATHKENMNRGSSLSHATARTGVCQKGHKIEGRNLIDNGHGARLCRACHNERQRRYQQAKRAATA
jgi:hypothetical protein